MEQKFVRRRTTAGYGAKSWWLPLRRLCPVNTSTLKCLVCFICHNSKGKASCAIILMDFSDEAKGSFGTRDSGVPTAPGNWLISGFSAALFSF